MSDPFISAKLRIGRAKELFNALVKDARAFADSDPHIFIAEIDPDGLSKTYKCRLRRPTPALFDFLIVEIVEHLRASLDYLGYAAAVLGGKKDPKRCYFPVANTAANLDTQISSSDRFKDLPSDILAFFRSLEPYETGKGKAIWVINQLCNIGKHRFLTTVGLHSGSTDITAMARFRP